MKPAKEPTPACPRCGYDLSGLVATWQESCPLEGTCSECGNVFECKWVMRPELAAAVGFFETSEHRLVKAFSRTALRALRPWFFWRWVRMEYRPSVGRMFVGGVLTLLLRYVFVGVVLGVVAAGPAIYKTWTLQSGSYWRDDDLKVVWRLAVWPWGDVDRWNWYSSNAPTGVGETYGLLAAVTVVLIPAAFLLLPITMKRAKVRRVHLLRIFAWSLFIVPVTAQAALLIPLALIAWTNRASSPFSMTPSAWGTVMELAQWLDRNKGEVLITVTVAWLLVWWGFACSRYLKLPRAWPVAVLMVVLALVGATVACALVPGWLTMMVW